jgi:hypothetical protein
MTILQKRIIKFIDVKTPHAGLELYNNIQNYIQDWSIEDKLFGIILIMLQQITR